MSTKPKVVVLGGGFGGLESTFYLRHKLGDKVDLTLVPDRDHFVFKPNTIYIPFGEDPERFHIALETPTRRKTSPSNRDAYGPLTRNARACKSMTSSLPTIT